MGSYTARTITLLRRPMGEANHLVVFLSADRGRIRAVSRSTRKPKSKLAAGVQPFVQADVMFGQGRGDLDVVAQVQVIDSFRPLREDLRRMAHATYWAEVLDRGVEEGQEALRLYGLLLSCMKLATMATDLLPVTAYFELHAMRELGFQVALRGCPDCGAEIGEGSSFWSPSQGGIVCADCLDDQGERRRVQPEAREALSRLERTRASRLLPFGATPEAVREAESLLRRFVGYHMDVGFKSLEFLQQVEGLSG